VAEPQPHPDASTALALGVAGLLGGFLLCLPFVLSPFAWITGRRVLHEIDASAGRYSGREQAGAGYLCGVIGSVLLAAIMAVLVGFVVVVVLGLALSDNPFPDPEL
jgi:hypothetical protein